MGLIGRAHKVNLIVGLLSGDSSTLSRATDCLVRIFGRPDLQSPLMDFTQTEYYKKEMGGSLKRLFLSFEKLLPLNGIYAVKLKAGRLEQKFSLSGRRVVNIDPGYLDLAKLVLFSTKDYSHRIYLDRGIFAETTLVYKDKSFNPWPWTYPDYATAGYIEFFNRVRGLYKEKIGC